MKKLIKWIMISLLVIMAATIFLIWKGNFRTEALILLAFGFFTHIVGDFLTKEGLPLFWPNKRIRLGLKIFRTGGTFETVFGFALLVANVYLIYLFFQRFNVLDSSYWQQYWDLFDFSWFKQGGSDLYNSLAN